ncbi:hypothetical protein CPB83DRAFT_892055 [Crepidotus variabilis]|uniref:Uncharacterized protein n=1 Tax=Crepidotus variabilis TaxID=179855 RepID=A0A9P6JT53_9AGAR|nr:hypothetical protein CPB83DRAFT_892055 [Crepidotus variabilis]
MPLQVNGVEAWITTGDKVPVKEYAVDLDEETGVATCWISGEPGETFAIRWRDLSDPIANPSSDGCYLSASYVPRDLSGFVMMDGYELGGRVLNARSHASVIFSRIATSPTSCVPLTFSNLPRTAGIGEDWVTLGAISLDIHVVEIGEANRLHEGYSSYYRRGEAAPLSSATPFSSTEVTSLRKIATFVFKYRPLDVLRYHSIAPVSYVPPSGLAVLAGVVAGSSRTLVPRLGDKRSAPEDDDECDSDLSPTHSEFYHSSSPLDDTMFSPTIAFSSSSDSDSSQDFTQRIKPRRPTRVSSYGCGSQQQHQSFQLQPPPSKRIKL